MRIWSVISITPRQAATNLNIKYFGCVTHIVYGTEHKTWNNILKEQKVHNSRQVLLQEYNEIESLGTFINVSFSSVFFCLHTFVRQG